MATPVEPLEEAPAPEREPDESRSVRRMLKALLATLLLASVVLLALLVWLLRPETAVVGAQGGAGYPIQVVRAIYGFGEDPAQLLKTPLGAAFVGTDRIWVSDTGHSRVLVFTTDGKLAQTLGTERGTGRVYTPYGIAADPNLDRVYVADYAGRDVQIFSRSGAYIGHLPADDQPTKVFGPNGFSPYDVQVLNGRVVVSSNDGIYFFDSTGHVVARWGGEVRGVKLGMFNFPDSFTVDHKSGRVYVADTMNRRIVALDENGKWLWVSGSPDVKGKITGFWQLPRGIALGPDGNLYVVDTFRFDRKGIGTGHIVVLSPEGELLSEFGRVGMGEDAFNFPEQIVVSPDGVFAVADRENNRVLMFRLGPLPSPDEDELRLYATSFSHPKGVSATPAPGK